MFFFTKKHFNVREAIAWRFWVVCCGVWCVREVICIIGDIGEVELSVGIANMREAVFEGYVRRHWGAYDAGLPPLQRRIRD